MNFPFDQQVEFLEIGGLTVKRIGPFYFGGSIENEKVIEAFKVHGISKFVDFKPEHETPFSEDVLFFNGGASFKRIAMTGICDLNEEKIEALDQILSANQGDKIMLYCRSGNRSLYAFARLWQYLENEKSSEIYDVMKQMDMIPVTLDKLALDFNLASK